jgi:hypothetical protein
VVEAGAEGCESGSVVAHAVAVAVDLKDGGVVEESVEDRGGDGGVFEDLAPAGDAAVGGEDDRAVFVAAADDLEEVARGGGGQREVPEFVGLCGYPHRSTCADSVTMPMSSPWPG